MKLIVQPGAGIAPIVSAIKHAKKSVDIVIFRFDRTDIEKALAAAVSRGVAVRTLIAHTNKGGEKTLRKLELRLLAGGVTVARTADDLVRYHGKLMIIDRTILHLYGFNFTGLDIGRSRSFGLISRKRQLVQEAVKLFEADATRQPYTPGAADLVVSPENARERLSTFLRKAKRQLLIYDPNVNDTSIIRILHERASAGVDVRILGKIGKRGAGLHIAKYPGRRLHVRAIVRDGRRAFLGSQSLRKPELDARREVGAIVGESGVIKQMTATFENDWASSDAGKAQKRKDNKKDAGKKARKKATAARKR